MRPLRYPCSLLATSRGSSVTTGVNTGYLACSGKLAGNPGTRKQWAGKSWTYFQVSIKALQVRGQLQTPLKAIIHPLVIQQTSVEHLLCVRHPTFQQHLSSDCRCIWDTGWKLFFCFFFHNELESKHFSFDFSIHPAPKTN